MACRNCCHIRAKKAAFFTLFYKSKTVSSQFLSCLYAGREGIWSFDGDAQVFRVAFDRARQTLSKTLPDSEKAKNKE